MSVIKCTEVTISEVWMVPEFLWPKEDRKRHLWDSSGMLMDDIWHNKHNHMLSRLLQYICSIHLLFHQTVLCLCLTFVNSKHISSMQRYFHKAVLSFCLTLVNSKHISSMQLYFHKAVLCFCLTLVNSKHISSMHLHFHKAVLCLYLTLVGYGSQVINIFQYNIYLSQYRV